MSVARCLEINARMRAARVTVHEWAGWQSRGNGQSSAYEGGIAHHTASAYGFAYQTLVTGRADLAGPLCNYAGNADGSLTIIAAHPANHAGASGGRSMGPLPVTTLFNKQVLGLEIVYPGTSPMRDAQYRSALLWSRIVTDVCGYGDIERARAHAETSITGKWDPGDAPGRTINMVAFRAAAHIIAEVDMQSDERQWLWDLWRAHYRSAEAPGQQTVHDAIWANRNLIATVIAAQKDDLDSAAVLAQLDSSVRAATTEALNTTVMPAIQRIEEALGRDDVSEAKAIVTELAERLRPAA